MKLFVGLDVSSDKLDVCFLTAELEIIHKGSYHNDIDGASLIKEKILSLCMKYPLSIPNNSIILTSINDISKP